MATRLISRQWLVGGVLTDVTTAKLSDPTGTFGVKRNDTDAVVVADNTAMTKASTGTYEYSFNDVEGVTYTACVEIVYGGSTYYVELSLPASSASSLQLGFDDIRIEVADYLGYLRTESKWTPTEKARLESIIRSGLLQVYYPQQVDVALVHKWSWMRPQMEVATVARYSTGTIAVVAGVVTLSGSTFPSWAADGELTVNGVAYSVASRDSDTQITLDDTSVTATAGATYSLGKPVYVMESTFDGQFDGPLHYGAGVYAESDCLTQTSDAQLRSERQRNNTTGKPWYFAMRPAAYDPTVGQRWEITFWPTPDAAYSMFGRYRVKPTMMDSTNKYPMGGIAMSGVFLQSCLAIAEQRLNGQAGMMTQQFIGALQAAIADDAASYSPDYLGTNQDSGGNRYRFPHGREFTCRLKHNLGGG